MRNLSNLDHVWRDYTSGVFLSKRTSVSGSLQLLLTLSKQIHSKFTMIKGHGMFRALFVFITL